MRFIMLALCLSACSAYPVIDWPATATTAGPPALLPQAALGPSASKGDPGQDLVARSAALHAWAAGVAP